MRWYLAKIVFRIICGEGSHKPQFDEQLRVLRAVSMHEAIKKATETGWKGEDVFYNDCQKLVQWKFIAVSEVYSLSDQDDGAEVYSRILEWDDADKYMKLIQSKSAKLRSEIEEKLIEQT